jgi:RNA 3'-terminal phosphate cyclase (ATP)
MIYVDGSMGEGGGQVLRTALALALLTGKPFRIEDIRAGRPKPGLAAQHLKSVEAAAAVGQTRVEGATKGAAALTFAPEGIRPGAYRFDVGTAGATSLVLQTVAIPLALAPGESLLTITGGTHVPCSPSFHYLREQWVPALRGLGFRLEVDLVRPGFYPRGGGEIGARLGPAAGPPAALRAMAPGRLLRVKGTSAAARLDPCTAERQARRARERLSALGVPVEVETARVDAPSPGTFLFLDALFERGRFCATGLGERGKPAERVADEAVAEVEAFLGSGAAIDPHLADQLLLPLTLAPGDSEFTTARVTRHLTTNAAVFRLFLPKVGIEIEGEEGSPGRVVVLPGPVSTGTDGLPAAAALHLEGISGRVGMRYHAAPRDRRASGPGDDLTMWECRPPRRGKR